MIKIRDFFPVFHFTRSITPVGDSLHMHSLHNSTRNLKAINYKKKISLKVIKVKLLIILLFLHFTILCNAKLKN